MIDKGPAGEATTNERSVDEAATHDGSTDEALTAEPTDVAAEAAAHMTDTTQTADMTATAKAAHVATAEAAREKPPLPADALTLRNFAPCPCKR
jgi:hypothetical protein